MRVLFLLLISVSLFSQQKIRFELKQKHNYCGGAKPSPEMLASFDNPKPFANQKLIIVSSKGKVDSLVTTEEGVFEKKLKNDSYKIYEAWKYHKTTPNCEPMENFDKECLKKFWKTPCITLKIKFKSILSNIKIEKAYCQHEMPCIKNPHLPE